MAKIQWNKKNDILALMVGHGTQLNGVWDSGCTYGKYTEAELMLDIVKVAVKCLRRSGVRVLTDADKGNNRNMKSSVAWANRNGCKYYCSCHCDYKLASAGVAPLYKTEAGKKLAVGIGKTVAKKMGMTWKGAFKRDDLFELNATKMTASILELGAIKADLNYLKDYKKFGRSLAKAICKYIGVEYVTKSKAEKLADTTAKTVQDMNNMHFKYKNAYKECGMSWDKAKKTKKSNCATMISYALQRAGILNDGQIFWINGNNIVCKGDGCTENVRKNFKISHPHKKPKECKLQVGDICGYGTPHTQMFAGWKDGKPTWYSWGGKDVGCKEPKVKKTYNTRPIDTILRLKQW